MRNSKCRSRDVIVWILSLGLLTSAAHARNPKSLGISALNWSASAVSSYLSGKALDKALGVDIEQNLDELRRDLERQIQEAEPESVERLQAELEETKTNLGRVSKLLRGKPSREELQALQDQVSSDFNRIYSRLAAHDEHFRAHESEIEELRRSLAKLEEFYPRQPRPIPDNLPANPRVAILSLGEPTLAGAVEAELENQLLALQIEASGGGNSIQLSDLLHQYGETIPVGKLVPFLAAEGFHVLVLARVELVGYRDLYYYGNHSQATNARLRLNTYLLHGERALGRGWNKTVEYTALNADWKAEEALDGAAPEIAAAIEEGWRALLQRSRS